MGVNLYDVKLYSCGLLTMLHVFCMSLRPSSFPSPLTSSPVWCISTCTVQTVPCMASLITHFHSSMSVTSRMAQDLSTRSMLAFRWKFAGNQGISQTFRHLLRLLYLNTFFIYFSGSFIFICILLRLININ